MDFEVRGFRERGWSGPFPLLTKPEAAALCDLAVAAQDRFTPPQQMRKRMPAAAFEKRPWFKSMHAYVPELMALAAHPSIVEKVVAVLGPDVVVWGLSVSQKAPDEVHRWHVDVETRRWRGISAFVAMTGTTPGYSGLRFLNGSHALPESPQDRHIQTDDDALRWAKSAGTPTEIVEPPVNDGDFVLFEGSVWHASHNRTPQTRTAIIIQYSRPDADVAIPLTWNAPIVWHSYRPPCNTIVVPPVSSRAESRDSH